MKAVRILIGDDHEIVRRGLRALLSSRSKWEVVAEAATGREAVESARRLKPDIVILDITMPDSNGLDAARIMSRELPKTEILILTMHESLQLAREVINVGARGCVLKSDAESELLTAVETLSQHRTYISKRLAEMVVEGFFDKTTGLGGDQTPQPELTSRERSVVQLLAKGKSNKEVAQALGISVKTVETHRGHVMRKLNLHSITDLVHYAIRSHIVEP